MAKNFATLNFKGDTKDLTKAYKVGTDGAEKFADKIGKSSKEFDRAGDRMDRFGERADDLDTRAMGFRDTITGVQDLTAGLDALNDESVSTGDALLLLGMGVGDLASGVANLGAPALKAAHQFVFMKVTAVKSFAVSSAAATKNFAIMSASAVKNFAVATATQVASYARAAVAAGVSFAVQIGQWIALGVTSLISAAQVAAAWLISMAPIIIVTAAVIGLAYLIYRNWDSIKKWTVDAFKAVGRAIMSTFEWVKNLFVTYVNFYVNIYKKVWHGIKWVWTQAKNFASAALSFIVTRVSNFKNNVLGLVRKIPGAIRSAMSGVARMITAPFTNAFQGIKNTWNRYVGGKGFSVPSWIPGVGGRSFKIPKLAEGGIVRQPTLALIGEAGPERVEPLTRSNSGNSDGGRAVLEIVGDETELARFLLELLRKSIRAQGGNVQGVIGG